MLKKVFLILAALILSYVIFSYARVEILTFQHKSEFQSLYKLTNMIDDGIDYLKVMEYSKEFASIYYVGEERSYGIKIEFIKKDGNWDLKEWATIWSKSGSAEGMIWPYYR